MKIHGSTNTLRQYTNHGGNQIEEFAGEDHEEPHATKPPDKKDSSADPLPIVLTVSKNSAAYEVLDDPLRRRRFEDFKSERLSDAVVDRGPVVDESPTDIPDPLDLQGKRSGDPKEKFSKDPAADEVSGDPPVPHVGKPEDHGEERTADPLEPKMISADPTTALVQDRAFPSPLPPLLLFLESQQVIFIRYNEFEYYQLQYHVHWEGADEYLEWYKAEKLKRWSRKLKIFHEANPTAAGRV
ncbi:hypothetical protein E4U52_000955 [Claviceps spartinae]|nr:hypothetical protein E4U52_000955 [Claviceps spartinae]